MTLEKVHLTDINGAMCAYEKQLSAASLLLGHALCSRIGHLKGTLMKRLLMTLGVGVALAAFAAPAHAVPYSFYCITNNNGGACSSLLAQLQVDVTAGAGGTVDFKFTNAVGVASSITDVYFDDDTLLAIANITSSAGVAFSTPATPASLPSQNTAIPPFVTTIGHSADSNSGFPGVAANGVNAAGEFVTINFTLQSGQTYASTLTALDSGTLRIGMHVQAIGTTGGSDSLVNTPGTPDTPVPEPGTLLLLGAGLSGLAARRRRR